nr:hypothetical protein [Neorhizobium sp. 2083]
MDVVHVPHDSGSFGRECRSLQTSQKIGLHDATVNICHSRFDILPELELALALGNLDGAHLPRPFEDILEKMAMDRLQVLEIKVALRDIFARPHRNDFAFVIVELAGIG